MEALFVLLVWAGLGYWTSTIAKRKGKNTTLAFFAGIFFGLIAVLVYSLLEDKKKK